jgi:MFS family permease
MFTDAKERAKAFGLFSAIAGSGGAVGLVLGGVLTEYLNWRWTFFVNVPFAAIAVAGAVVVIREPSEGRNPSRLDIPGVLLATLGLVSLVYGFTRAETDGWSAGGTAGLFVAAAVLLVAFTVVESKAKAPLLPLRVVTERNRGGAYLSMGLGVIGLFGLFLFLTYYLQIVKEYSPVMTGLAFLPLITGLIVGSTQISARLILHIAPRLLMGPGLLAGAVGMLMLTQIDLDTSYPVLILPAFVLLGLGLGTAFMTAISLATHGVHPRDTGIASAMINTSQQVGGAIGTALLNTIAAGATTAYATTHPDGATSTERLQSLVHGYTTAIWWAVGILIVAAAVAIILVDAQRQAYGPDGEDTEEESIPVMTH